MCSDAAAFKTVVDHAVTDEVMDVRLEGMLDTTYDLRLTARHGRVERRVDFLNIPESARITALIKVVMAGLGSETMSQNNLDGDSRDDSSHEPDFAARFAANYNSEGCGVSFTVELDQSLLNKPRELQEKIAHLHREADTALEPQAQQRAPSDAPPRGSDDHAHQPVSREHRNGNGHTSSRTIAITSAQRRAIDSIGRRLELDVDDECRPR